MRVRKIKLTLIDKFSLIGDWGFKAQWIDRRPFLDVAQVGIEMKRAGKNKALPNPYEDIRPEDEKQ